ncbi:MAG: type II secretion system F family protein [DPANN group archaeon]|nr:type II secretion system F family protein [DPANN group archaeon]
MVVIPNRLLKKFARKLPGLALKLKQAGMPETPEEFVKKTIISAFYMTTGIGLFLFGIFAKLNINLSMIFFISLFLFFIFFGYFLKVPEAKISKKEREISREIVFAGRFLIIELESGITLYNAMINITANFPIIGKYFKEITDRIDLGTAVGESINETVQTTANADFGKILIQIQNVLKTGADMSSSLNSVLEQIVRDQTIEVKGYGKKLNPLAMFYMVIAVILPSLGIIGLLVLSSFLSITFDLTILIAIALLLGFIQFMFVAIIKSSRPAVDI